MFHMPQPAFYKGEIIPFLAAQDGWGGDSTTSELVFPVLAQEGDMAVAALISEVQTTPATPAGWTLRNSVLHQSRRYMLFSKIVEAGEPGTSDTVTMGSTVRTATVTQCIRRHQGNFDFAGRNSATSTSDIITFATNSRTDDGNLYTALACMTGSESGIQTYGNDVPDGRHSEGAPGDVEVASTAGVTFQGLSFSPNNWTMAGNQHWRSWTVLVW